MPAYQGEGRIGALNHTAGHVEAEVPRLCEALMEWQAARNEKRKEGFR